MWQVGIHRKGAVGGLSLLLYPGTVDVLKDMKEESNIDIDITVPEFDPMSW